MTVVFLNAQILHQRFGQVRGDMLNAFVYRIRWILFKWLNRRSQRKSYNWKSFTEVMKDFPLAKPRIYVSIYGD